jgi:hypothetical protein
VGRPSRRGNLGELQNLPTKDLQKRNPFGEKLPEHEGNEMVEWI